MDWNLIVSIATILTTLLGFVVTYKLTKRNLKDELLKSKALLGLEKMEEVPFKLLELLTAINEGETKQAAYFELMHTIYAYGTSDAVKIAITLQRNNYEMSKNQPNGSVNPPSFRPLTLLSLLITQVKYDLTGEIINPESWFVMRITDYTETEMNLQVKSLINDDVAQLQLNLAFLIK